jgi:hypothetical protein
LTVIVEWINAIETLIAETTDPNVVARLQEVNPLSVIENRITDDYYLDDEEFVEGMPFFVVRETTPLGFDMDSNDTMAGRGAIEVGFFEHANQYLGTPNLQVRNRLSKRYFFEFIDGVIQSVCERQNRGGTVPLSRVELIEPAKRTHPSMRDPDNPNTDFWLIRWRFICGVVGR